MKTLLLNSDWTPLHFISSRRAFNLLLLGRAEQIDVGEGPSVWSESYTTKTQHYAIPATIRLLKRVSRTWPAPRFRKQVLFNRDSWMCQYCSASLSWNTVTIDHVVPKCRGGQTTWKNCVSACRRCNMRKGGRTPIEAGMKLLTNPAEPRVQHFWAIHQINRRARHPDWHCFFDSPSYPNEDNDRTAA